ncbi:SWIM zinc finger family protein [Verminephrobacter eiseniae]|uniref:SWIM zinc finger family protein n=1 Tax=Verminephrobacter eiseniae TaxID=364317 RepID=UPI002237FC08|nr:SWIM zinc finger family protein [Verminephrobacter eiseniae]MCW5233663.1 hypothetical protein [Verminephrobacter eiseniae]MCW5294782.1 hypothetical protein [Verminephrobacter eiseniae]MCW8185392.1 hypothetical protein [Verminephrobacter eiseniae]MCW8222032.1 hypothetical protein [Verminephrobacter eiseniae]MCW8233834.1 hypothetical protein [Verminephrobacter eiseniae]
MGFRYGGWAPYIPVAQRQYQARQKIAALKRQQGYVCQPVAIEGRTIAKSFWGKAWCDNLEAYSDFSNRLPRGQTYVRNGSVIDLRVETGKIWALVSGSDIYTVEIGVQPLAATMWDAIIKKCSGKIDSLVELLQGRLSRAVMETVTHQGQGLFPLPRQISLRCSCPDGASMCKHVAAVLYGVGARLDKAPELLFRLRHVDPQELTRKIGALPSDEAPGTLDDSDLSALFGIDIGAATPPPPVAAATRKRPQTDQTARRIQSSPVATRKRPQVSKPAAAPPGAVRAAPPAAASAKTGSAAAPRRARSGTRAKTVTVTASDLIARGVARHMLQSWIAGGVLLRTGQRGVYGTTAQTEARIAAYLARVAGR